MLSCRIRQRASENSFDIAKRRQPPVRFQRSEMSAKTLIFTSHRILLQNAPPHRRMQPRLPATLVILILAHKDRFGEAHRHIRERPVKPPNPVATLREGPEAVPGSASVLPARREARDAEDIGETPRNRMGRLAQGEQHPSP